MTGIFDNKARALFAGNYPEVPHKLLHGLQHHDLLTLEAIAKLSEQLPEKSREYNKGDLPIGLRPGGDVSNGLSIGETIRNIEQCRSWAVLKNIEQIPGYRDLLLSLLEELRPAMEAKTGKMLTPQGFIFVSSPDAVTPYHFDPEHNILLQLRGEKWMTQFPADDRELASAQQHEAYHTGGPRELVWHDEYADKGTEYHLTPGDAMFVPVMAPHFVRNGPKPSISLSITWRSEWSYAESDAHAMNMVLRKMRFNPVPPGRFPAQNKAKAFLWRAMRKLKLVH